MRFSRAPNYSFSDQPRNFELSSDRLRWKQPSYSFSLLLPLWECLSSVWTVISFSVFCFNSVNDRKSQSPPHVDRPQCAGSRWLCFCAGASCTRRAERNGNKVWTECVWECWSSVCLMRRAEWGNIKVMSAERHQEDFSRNTEPSQPQTHNPSAVQFKRLEIQKGRVCIPVLWAPGVFCWHLPLVCVYVRAHVCVCVRVCWSRFSLLEMEHRRDTNRVTT